MSTAFAASCAPTPSRWSTPSGFRTFCCRSYFGLSAKRYSLVAPCALSYATPCRLVVGGRSATHVVFSSTRPLGRRRGVALVDDLAAARAAECRIDNTAIGRARTVQLRIAVRCCEGRHADATTNQFRACNADTNADGNATTHGVTHTRANTITHSNTNAGSDTNTNAGSDTNTNAGSDTDTNAGAPNLQPRLHHRDGKRGVEQPHWE